LAFSINDTVCSITEDSKVIDLELRKKKDGLIIFIDEADSANQQLDLGTVIKNISESLHREGCNEVVFILAGLPRLRNVLAESHESSLRIFEELELEPLSDSDVEFVINRGLELMNEKMGGTPITIDDEALKLISYYSEGYPHFVQQIGASTVDHITNNHITANDVAQAMLKRNGALDLIGDRYYRDIYWNRISAEAYRQILQIMSEKYDEWMSLSDIRKEFKGKDSTLRNGIKALTDRNIILRKEGTRGYYRLQWKGFAAWIKFFSEREKNRE